MNTKTISSTRVGQLYKHPDTCNLYVSHTLHQKIHNYFQALDDDGINVEAVGCSSCRNCDVYYTSQGERKQEKTEVYLGYPDRATAQKLVNTAEETDGVTVEWDGDTTTKIYVRGE